MEQINIMRLIPRFLWADRNCHALAMAIETALNHAGSIIAQSERWMNDVDAMPEWMLNERLWEFGLTPTTETPVTNKRALLKARYIIVQNNGTEEALIASLHGIDPKATYETDGYSVDIMLTADGMTASTFTDAMNMADKVVPAYISAITCSACQTVAMYMNAVCMVEDVAYDRKPEIMDAMKAVARASVHDVLPSLRLKLNGTDYGTADYEGTGLYKWSVAFEGDVTDVTMEDSYGKVAASRTMDASYAKDTYAMKVIQHWNDPTADEGSMKLTEEHHAQMIMAMALAMQTRMVNMRVLCMTDSGDSVDLNVSGVQITDDNFEVRANLPTGDDALTGIRSMILHDTDGNVYASANAMDDTAATACRYRDKVMFVFSFSVNREDGDA